MSESNEFSMVCGSSSGPPRICERMEFDDHGVPVFTQVADTAGDHTGFGTFTSIDAFDSIGQSIRLPVIIGNQDYVEVYDEYTNGWDVKQYNKLGPHRRDCTSVGVGSIVYLFGGDENGFISTAVSTITLPNYEITRISDSLMIPRARHSSIHKGKYLCYSLYSIGLS